MSEENKTIEVTEKDLDKISGGTMCPDGVDRYIEYHNYLAADCPNCHLNGYVRLTQATPYRSPVWGRCTKCDVVFKVAD